MPIGSVKTIWTITPNGQAAITFSDRRRLRAAAAQGTRAVIRHGVAVGHRQPLRRPRRCRRRTRAQEIPGRRPHHSRQTTPRPPSTSTSSSTRSTADAQGAAGLLQGPGARSSRARRRRQTVGFHYLNPALSTSRRLFNELNRDTPPLERFLDDSSRLVVGALAERRDDLSALMGNLNDDDPRDRHQKARWPTPSGACPTSCAAPTRPS